MEQKQRIEKFDFETNRGGAKHPMEH